MQQMEIDRAYTTTRYSMEQLSLEILRAEYDRKAGRSLSLPIAGAVAWAIFAVAGVLLDTRSASLVILFGSGVIFPIGLVISRVLGEQLTDSRNPLARLMGLSVLMVNLLWALHLTLLAGDMDYLPLSLGIGLGIHWIVFSWIINHPLGIVHAILRTGLVTALWWLFPAQRIEAVAAGVVIAYIYAILALATRRPNLMPE